MGYITSILEVFTLSNTDGLMILVSLGLFLAFYASLKKLFFTPYLELYTAREEATVGSTIATSDAIAELARVESEIESELASARESADAERKKLLSNAKQVSSDKIAEAEKEVAGKIQASRAELENEINKEREKLLSDIDSRGTQIVEMLIN